MKNNLLLFLILLCIPSTLFAYLDPGSGSMLFSAIVGIIATLFFVLKSFIFKIVNIPAYLSGKKSGISKTKTDKIVFYSEGHQYWNVFLPILRELNNRQIPCTFLYSKKNDPVLENRLEYVNPIYIGEGNKAFFMLNTLSADVCVMTTPGLDVLQIKRSPGVKKYIHIPHSTGGCSGYATYGLDYYDVVLTGGDADIAMIRELEEVRKQQKKQIEAIGCTYMDILRENLSTLKPDNFNFDPERKTVLLSPTWGLHGLLRKFGEKIMSDLIACKKYNIIVRPHPQAFVSDKDLIDDLMQKFPDSETLFWDKAPHGLQSMNRSDIMISDFSGIIFDYILLFGKPVLAFKGKYDKRGHDSMDLAEDPWNLQAVEKTGISIEESDVEKLTSLIEAKLKDTTAFSSHLKYLHEGMDKYPNETGRRGADAIMKVIQELKD